MSSNSRYLLWPVALAGMLFLILWQAPQVIGETDKIILPPPHLTTPQLIVDGKNFDYHQPSIAIGTDDRVHLAYGEDQVYYAVRHADGKQYQIVHVAEGWAPKLALDAQDRPHIMYISTGAGVETELRYVQLMDNGRWQDELITTLDDPYGSVFDFVLDATDQPHIIWRHEYFYKSGSTWHTLTYATPIRAKLAVDATNTVYIAYTGTNYAADGLQKPPPVPHPTPYMMRVIQLKNGVWQQLHQLDLGEMFNNPYIDIQIDSQDKPHIIYNTDFALHYAKLTVLGWQTSLVSSESAYDIALTLSTQNEPQAAYINDEGIIFGRIEGTGWKTWLQVPNSIGLGGPINLDIVLNSQNDVYIPYLYNLYGYNTITINLNWWTGNEWAITEIDRAEPIEFYRSVGTIFDVYDQPVVYFHDNTRKLARPLGNQWLVEDIRLEEGYGSQYAYMAFDQQNRLHHIEPYLDHSLLHHIQIDGTWETITLTHQKHLNLNSIRLVADQHNQLHLIYSNHQNEYGLATDHTLYYGRFDGTAWVTDTVDAGDFEAYTHDLAIDHDGLPHIVAKLGISETVYQPVIRYYTLSDTNWVSETFHISDDYYNFYIPPFILTDSQNQPTIFPNTYTIHYYLQWSGTEWLTHTLPFDGEYVADVALDANDNLHLIEDTFYSDPNKLYAFQQQNVWMTHTITVSQSTISHFPIVKLAADKEGGIYLLTGDSQQNQLAIYMPTTYTHTLPISAAGGTLNYRTLTAEFPPNSFDTPTDITAELFYTPRHLPPNYFSPGYQVDIRTSGENTATYTLTLTYEDTAIAPFNEARLSLHHWDGSTWTAVSSTVDTETNTVTAEVSEFGRYALLTAATHQYLPLTKH